MSISLHWLVILERMFLGVLGGACLYILYFSTTNHHHLPISPDTQTVESTAESTISASVLPSLPSYENYASKINRRDLFSSSTVSTDLSTLTAAPGALPGDLKVVGIVVGNPSEVIIENTISHQTLFIQQGKETDGISIQKVQAHQVILSYKGESVVIPLKENK